MRYRLERTIIAHDPEELPVRPEIVQRDIRETSLFRDAEALYQASRRPGTGQISDAAELSASGSQAVFAGTLVDSLDGTQQTRICLSDLVTGEIRVLTFGPNIDRLPKFSPDGRCVAYLSDRHRPSDFQLYLLEPAGGAVRPAPRVDGWVEYLHWSPDGRRILLGVAGHGADVSGGQGAVTSKQTADTFPSWVPTVETGTENYRWRRVWLYEIATNRVRPVGDAECNVWEAVWCGSQALATVVSPGPAEGLWYGARLRIVQIETCGSREAYAPKDQIGWPAASPSGRHLVIVEALCSDRGLVAGDLRLIDTSSGEIRRVDTHGVDIACTEWRSDRQLLLAGHREFETVVSLYDVVEDACTEVWRSRDITTGGRYVTVSGLDDSGDCVLVGESFVRAPEVAVIRRGQYRAVKSFDLARTERSTAATAVERVSWQAPDGLEIQGWLLRPEGKPPYPLVMNIHGGPVSHWRPTWLGRASVPLMMLINRGYAVFLPNPRGSSGRGQDFARRVLGDMGGADTYDYLSGLDHLVLRDIADPRRLGVMGRSYGGFMSSWLITQDSRFAAAVPVSPVTNQVTEHLISNIPHFVALFLADTYTNANGKYFQRSPVMYAHRVKTPTLNICGALDRCTPPEEAVQFHNALLENGVRSVLVTYPEEGHGVRKLPAAIDFAARVVAWFEDNMPLAPARSSS
jgi:dipeptidyl aminopeptidase/acylaminoacyl peptidase